MRKIIAWFYISISLYIASWISQEGAREFMLDFMASMEKDGKK